MCFRWRGFYEGGFINQFYSGFLCLGKYLLLINLLLLSVLLWLIGMGLFWLLPVPVVVRPGLLLHVLLRLLSPGLSPGISVLLLLRIKPQKRCASGLLRVRMPKGFGRGLFILCVFGYCGFMLSRLVWRRISAFMIPAIRSGV